MPNRPTNIYWRERVQVLTEENPTWGPGRVAAELQKEAARMHRTDFPSERTIGRLQHDYRARPADERLEYRRVRWPESMGTRDLPWESSAAVLELLYAMHQGQVREGQARGRPLVRVAKWFWRATMAAPTAPVDSRFETACSVAAFEAAGGNSSAARSAEWFLAYAPWTSSARSKEYDEAIANSGADFTIEYPSVPEPIRRFVPMQLDVVDRAVDRESYVDVIESMYGHPITEDARQSWREYRDFYLAMTADDQGLPHVADPLRQESEGGSS